MQSFVQKRGMESDHAMASTVIENAGDLWQRDMNGASNEAEEKVACGSGCRGLLREMF